MGIIQALRSHEIDDDVDLFGSGFKVCKVFVGVDHLKSKEPTRDQEVVDHKVRHWEIRYCHNLVQYLMS